MDIYSEIALKIVQHQETIIGPVAVDQAENIDGMKVDWPAHSINITGEPKNVIDQLVQSYADLFGQISVEVSKEAVAPLKGKLSADQLPSSLR